MHSTELLTQMLHISHYKTEKFKTLTHKSILAFELLHILLENQNLYPLDSYILNNFERMTFLDNINSFRDIPIFKFKIKILKINTF